MAGKLRVIGKFIAISALVLPAVFAGGCESIGTVDLVADGSVKVDRVDSVAVDLSMPAVQRSGDTIQISGTVTRQPGNDQPIPGFVQILFLTPAGDVLDEIDPNWQPSEIPTDGSRQASYSVNYLWVPPPGTVVRVAYATSYDNPGPSDEGNAGHGGHGGGRATHAPSRTGHYNGPTGTGTYGSFGRGM